MAAPEDWIGKQVTFGMEGENLAISGELAEVSDRGIVLVTARGDAPQVRVFYPWRVIRLIQLEPGQQPDRDMVGMVGI